MMRENDRALLQWELHGQGDPPPLAAAALAAREREDQVARFAQFGEPYRREDGTMGNVADLVPDLVEAQRQLELQFGSMSKRALVRLELANAIELKVAPITDDGWIHSLPERLRQARKSFCLGFRPSDGRRRIMWDQKAGLSRICPDDAREDSARMQRRVIEPLLALKKNGSQVTYAVFTLPNYQPGELRKGIKRIYKSFSALLKRRKAGRLEFHNVEAAMCVLEAPLARDRTWNVHLNVLLVHRGFLDWRAMQAAWRYGVHFQRIRGGKAELESAMREIIKYSARAVAEKSQCESSSSASATSPRPSGWSGPALASTPGRSPPAFSSATSGSDELPCSFDGAPVQTEIEGCPMPAPSSGGPALPVDTETRLQGDSRAGPPAMCDWTGAELLEWLTAFRGFRRTRTYRALYRLAKPAKDDLAGYLWVGKGTYEATGFRVWLGPLFSIPGDKSTTPDHLERWQKWVRGLKPPDPPPRKWERFA